MDDIGRKKRGKVTVLRWGHRHVRDERITSHVCLVARAFGADEIIVSGEDAKKIVSGVNRVSRLWGGGFKARYDRDWRKVLEEWGGRVVHLTMYGEPLQKRMEDVRKLGDVLVVVGSQKVPREIYEMADYNISVTGQPHSEVAALAVFLDRWFGGTELERKFAGGEVGIRPSAKGKDIVRKKSK